MSTKKSSQKRVAQATKVDRPVTENQSVTEPLVEEQSVTEQSAEEQSVVEQPVEEQSVVEQPAEEQSVTEQLVVENSDAEQPSQQSPKSPLSQVIDIRIADIVPNPMNPRRYFDEESLLELAQNIVEHGVLQPVTVREVSRGDGSKYEIIFGERRFRATKIAGLETIPCTVRDLNDEAAFDLMISENLQRQDILPSEEGGAFQRIIARGKDIRYICERFGKSDTFIHSRLSLVRLIPEITDLLNIEQITIGMAVEISKLEPSIQIHLLKEHLETPVAFNNWKNLPLKAFKEKMEATYTVLLSRFSFDKAECAECMYNSEFYSLFPVPENSRCTRSACLVKKQENFFVDGVLSAMGNESLEVYLNNGGGVHTEIITRLGELGIEVKTGQVYPMPENPVMPSEGDFEGNKYGFEQAQREFNSKQIKWNALHNSFENGLVRKVIMIENMSIVFGYVMITPKQENNPENRGIPNSPQSPNDYHVPSDHSDSSTDTQNPPQPTAVAAINPDLITKLEQKDQQNREEALCKVVDEAKKLIREVIIPPAAITPFEDALMNYIMLPFLDVKHHEFFGLPDDRKMTEEERVNLYSSLSDEQVNVLKRDFIIYALTQTSGVNKKSALFIEFAMYHFPDEMAAIEHEHNDEYQKKHQVIQEQIDRIVSQNEELKKVA